MRFDAAFAAQSPEAFVADVLVAGLGARYVLVGDDFRYGARRAGDYAMLDAAGARHGFDVARMMSYEVHGLRVSSSAVRAALAPATWPGGRPPRPALQRQRPRRPRRAPRPRPRRDGAGRGDGFRTLNVRFPPCQAAARASSSFASTASADPGSRSPASPVSASGRPSTTGPRSARGALLDSPARSGGGGLR